MAAGDKISSFETIGAGGYLTYQPVGTDQGVIHNIHSEGGIEIYITNGSNSILLERMPSGGSYQNRRLHCTNTYYIVIKNIEASAKYIAYDGVQTK